MRPGDDTYEKPSPVAMGAEDCTGDDHGDETFQNVSRQGQRAETVSGSRLTFVAPMFPLPCSRMSTEEKHRVDTNPHGTDPSR